MSSTSKITLKSSDGVSFEVDEAVALQSQTIKHMIEDDLADSVIPLPKVTGEILGKVIEYCKEHVEAAASEDELNTRFQASQTPAYNIQLGFCLLRIAAASGLKVWDAEFVKVDKATLFSLVLAANFLDIKSLLDLTCQTVKDMVKGKTPEEIDKFFNSKNDFTPEEKEEARVNDFLPEEEEEARVNDFIPEEEEEARLNDFIPEEEDFIPEEEEEARLNDFIPEEEEEARDNYWVLER